MKKKNMKKSPRTPQVEIYYDGKMIKLNLLPSEAYALLNGRKRISH
jgi:hypothetical protein